MVSSLATVQGTTERLLRLPRPGRPLSRRNSLEMNCGSRASSPSIPHRRSTRPSAPRVSCRPFAFGNTSPDSSVSIQASASTASTRPESGTLCSRFAFILDAGTVHVVASRSNSSHQGRRGSLQQDHGVLPTPNPRGDPEDHEPIDRKRMARLSSQMSRSHHPVEKAMAPVPVRDARQSFPPFDGVFSPFKHGSIRHGRTARTADRAVLVELRRFLAGVHAHWDVPDVHAPISTDPRRSAFKIRLQGAVSSAMSRSRGSTFRESRIGGGRSARRSA